MNNVLKPLLLQRHTQLWIYRTLTWLNLMLWKWRMEDKKTRYQQNCSLLNKIHVMNNGLYQMGLQKKWGHILDKLKIKPLIYYIQSYQRSLLSSGYQGLFPWGKSGRGVKLTTHLHLVPRSRMHGAIPSFPQYTFISWCSYK
jgi:hypothetical protein